MNPAKSFELPNFGDLLDGCSSMLQDSLMSTGVDSSEVAAKAGPGARATWEEQSEDNLAASGPRLCTADHSQLHSNSTAGCVHAVQMLLQPDSSMNSKHRSLKKSSWRCTSAPQGTSMTDATMPAAFAAAAHAVAPAAPATSDPGFTFNAVPHAAATPALRLPGTPPGAHTIPSHMVRAGHEDSFLSDCPPPGEPAVSPMSDFVAHSTALPLSPPLPLPLSPARTLSSPSASSGSEGDGKGQPPTQSTPHGECWDALLHADLERAVRDVSGFVVHRGRRRPRSQGCEEGAGRQGREEAHAQGGEGRGGPAWNPAGSATGPVHHAAVVEVGGVAHAAGASGGVDNYAGGEWAGTACGQPMAACGGCGDAHNGDVPMSICGISATAAPASIHHSMIKVAGVPGAPMKKSSHSHSHSAAPRQSAPHQDPI